MNDFALTRRQEFFDDLAARLAGAGHLRNSEQWRREFLIAPVLTSPWGLNLRPWDIECEVSYPLTKHQRNQIKIDFGKNLSRVRPDYIVCPTDGSSVALLVEAKKGLSKRDPLNRHAAQVLIEQLVTRAPWAILTDGDMWMLVLQGKPLLAARSLTDLGNSIGKWQQLVGKDALFKTASRASSLMQILVTAGEQLHGRDPTRQEKEQLAAAFPKLGAHGFRVVAEPSVQYNSIAAVVGDRGRWWEPDPMGLMYWPDNTHREYSLAAYRAAFESLGFAECSHEAVESGTSKIVLFGKNGGPSHATCQTSSGLWVSKLGRNSEVLHDLYDLEGETFGRPVLIMNRKHSDGKSQQPAPAYSVAAARPQSR